MADDAVQTEQIRCCGTIPQPAAKLPRRRAACMADFQRLGIWPARQVTLEIDRLTCRFPQSETYGLTSQVPRRAVSIGSKVAQAKGNDGDSGFGKSRSEPESDAELERRLLVARDLGYLPESEFTKLNSNLAEEGRMLISFKGSLRSASAAIGLFEA